MLILQQRPVLFRRTRAEFVGVGFNGAAGTSTNFGSFVFNRRGLAVIQCFDQSTASHVVSSITVAGRLVEDINPGNAATRAFGAGCIRVSPGSHNVTVGYSVATSLVAAIAVWLLPEYLKYTLDATTGTGSTGTSSTSPFWRGIPGGLMLWGIVRGDAATATTYSGGPRNVAYEQVNGSTRVTVVEVPYPGVLTQAWTSSAGIGASIVYVR